MDELFLQIERVLMLSDMVTEKVTDYQQDKKEYKRWDEETPKDEKFR